MQQHHHPQRINFTGRIVQIQLLWKHESSTPLHYYIFPFLVRFVEKAEYANKAL